VTPGLTKLALTAHITASVGWLGAVAAFLALAAVGLTSEDAHVVRAVYLVLEPTGRYVLVPLSLASLLTGLVQSLGTKWGLFRHYWVLFKLLINVASVAILALYLQTLDVLADVAADTTSSIAQLRALGASPVLHATAALMLLLAATVLSVYKPRGTTRYGQRQQRTQRVVSRQAQHPEPHTVTQP
jgi:hypothetical protein